MPLRPSLPMGRVGVTNEYCLCPFPPIDGRAGSHHAAMGCHSSLTASWVPHCDDLLRSPSPPVNGRPSAVPWATLRDSSVRLLTRSNVMMSLIFSASCRTKHHRDADSADWCLLGKPGFTCFRGQGGPMCSAGRRISGHLDQRLVFRVVLSDVGMSSPRRDSRGRRLPV